MQEKLTKLSEAENAETIDFDLVAQEEEEEELLKGTLQRTISENKEEEQQKIEFENLLKRKFNNFKNVKKEVVAFLILKLKERK